jgi:hypothetical protein
MKATDYSAGIDASPTKEFFVEMLTRDISLHDAILDLLDNCVDGVLRKKGGLKGDQPYKGFSATIDFDPESFTISDNCGGIPWSEHDRAFRQGRPPQASANSLPTVGTYGIGMKRAIYKMGRSCDITTKSGNDTYRVAMSPAWFKDERSWHLDANADKSLTSEGTTIVVKHLLESAKEEFAIKRFATELIQRIESHYAVIIQKGFSVTVNGSPVDPKPVLFRFSGSDQGENIRPYVFSAKVDGVDVVLAVGLRDPIPSQNQVESDQEQARYSSDHAGWTVICNDRVVLYCDKEETTGWGEAGVPQYHPQFRAISGVVEFRSTDARKLPTTTTKRGIDLSSRLYSQIKNRMREGTKLFTNYTNHWKTREKEAKAQVSDVPKLSFSQLKTELKSLNMSAVKTGVVGKQYKPDLPRPLVEDGDDECRITYRRPRSKVMRLAKAYFGSDVDIDNRDLPSRVGEESFDRAIAATPGRKK